jgi:hypothetical protein
MKYRAVCPHCSIRFSRTLSILNVPHMRRECDKCGNSFRAVAWSEYLGNFPLAVVAALLTYLMLSGAIAFLVGTALLVALVVFAIWLWPYITVFEKVAATKTDDCG